MLTMQCPNKDQNWFLISESRYCVKCVKHSYKNIADILWKIIFLNATMWAKQKQIKLDFQGNSTDKNSYKIAVKGGSHIPQYWAQYWSRMFCFETT